LQAVVSAEFKQEILSHRAARRIYSVSAFAPPQAQLARCVGEEVNMLTTAGCPNREVLQQLLHGQLPPADATVVASHVQDCPHCRQWLDRGPGEDSRDLTGIASPLKADSPDSSENAGTLALEPDAIPPPLFQLELSGGDLRQGQIGPYQLQGWIGRGGMGYVYRAVHTRLDRQVALKILPTDRLSTPEAIERFEREMKAIGRLDHSHIVRATDAGEAAGVHYLAMDLIDGLDLGELVRRAGPLPIAESCELIIGLRS
jgi:hypothetical protein